ncbi:hypothetical protein FRC09_009053 [Ceratobasidium sp. 395]|nr:hypothetical protein FRC09_009053 [Ceratobasidium sp. 395]
MSATGLNRQWHRVDRGYRRDQEEVEKVLLAFVRNDKDIELAIKEQSDVLALMTTIQEVILTGQVVKLWGDCTARDNPPDVYEGRWVGTDRVMIKAIKDIEGESTVKLLRQEVVAWRQLQHANVLKFYGICYSEPTLFAITGWEDNGNILRYLQRQPEHDRVELLAQVALGLNYLHTFEPTIVHGDLRAANVLVSASGQAFITGFGINQIIALEEGAEIASAYLKNAGALRWMARNADECSRAVH